MTLRVAAMAWLLCAAVAAVHLPILLAAPAALCVAALLRTPSRSVRLGRLLAAGAVIVVAAVELRSSHPPPRSDSVARLIGADARLRVRAASDGDAHPSYVSMAANVMARQGDAAWSAASGRVLLYLPATMVVYAGDELEVFGRLEAPGGNMVAPDYADWLSRRGFVAAMSPRGARIVARPRAGPIVRAWRAVRTEVTGGLARALPARESAFAAALLFGGRHALPADVTADLVATGTTHLVAVTAFNLVLLYGVLVVILGPLIGNKRSAGGALLLAIAYGLLAGQTASVRRGEIILALLTLARWTGRPYDSAGLLLIAAAVVTVPDASLIADASFQMTFAAAAGLTIVAPAVQRGAAWFGERWENEELPATPLFAAVGASLALSLAVTATSLPISLAQFGTAPLYAPVANALLSPVVPLLTLLSALVGFAGWLAPNVATVPSAALWLLLHAVLGVLRGAAGLPGAVVSISVKPWPFAVGWYGGLLLLPRLVHVLARRQPRDGTAAAAERSRGRRARRPALASTLTLLLAGGVGAITVPTITAVRDGASSTRVRWLDPANRATVLVEGRNGLHLLIADGEAPAALAQELEAVRGQSERLSGLVLSHSPTPAPRTDVYALAAAVHASAVVFPAAPAGSPGEGSEQPTGSPAGSAAIRLVPVAGEAEIDLGGSDRLKILGDGRGGSVLLLVTSGRRFILNGSSAALHTLERWHEPVAADAIVLPRGPPSAEQETLRALRPAAIVLVGRWLPSDAEIVRGLAPAAEVIEFQSQHRASASTDRDGSVVFSTSR